MSFEIVRTLPDESVDRVNNIFPSIMRDTFGARAQYLPMPYGQQLSVASERDVELMLKHHDVSREMLEGTLPTDPQEPVQGTMNSCFVYDLRINSTAEEDVLTREAVESFGINPADIVIDKIVWNTVHKSGYMPSALEAALTTYAPSVTPRSSRSQTLLAGWVIRSPEGQKQTRDFRRLAQIKLGFISLGDISSQDV